MQSIFATALSNTVFKHTGLPATSDKMLSWLALLIMGHETISLWRMAGYETSA
jgi:hypothetical protein